jgi:hypothetical protein
MDRVNELHEELERHRAVTQNLHLLSTSNR